MRTLRTPTTLDWEAEQCWRRPYDPCSVFLADWFTVFAADVPAPRAGYGTSFMLLLFILGSVWIGILANRATSGGGFMKGFFLGNRGLGAWALALTATVQSGGTFMGFPSLVYKHGWIVALWIASYMVVPITGFGIIGKRLAHLSRRTGAVTVPDLFRTRFNSPAVGLTCTIFLLLYMSFLMFAQFKAGAIVMQLAWPDTTDIAIAEDVTPASETTYTVNLPGLPITLSRYHIGLLIFTITVVGYTLIGGFLGAVWTDLFQSLLMFVGVMILLYASLTAAGGLENATLTSLKNTGPGYVTGPGYNSAADAPDFLPLSLAISFFIVWVWGGVGTPAGLVRLMASQDTHVIRKSIYLLSLYNMGIYLPLIVICICGRALIPNLEHTDEIIPRLALMTTSKWPASSFVAGLILAAPFGAVMATVSSYLVVLSSAVVRDLYQRFVNPAADRKSFANRSMVYDDFCRFAVSHHQLEPGAVSAGIYCVQHVRRGRDVSGSRSDGVLLATSELERHFDKYAQRSNHRAGAVHDRDRGSTDAGSDHGSDIVPTSFSVGLRSADLGIAGLDCARRNCHDADGTTG